MNKYVNEMEDYLYNHNYISENNNNIKQQELSIERASCIVQKYRTLTEEKDKEIERLNKAINEIKEKIDDYFAYDYENESMARLDTLNEINHIIVELKEGKE